MTSSRDSHPVAGGTENRTTAARVARFNEMHGRLIVLNEDRTGATRLNALTEFNHAIVVSEHPLVDDHLFEVVIEQVTDRFVLNISISLINVLQSRNELHVCTLKVIIYNTIKIMMLK